MTNPTTTPDLRERIARASYGSHPIKTPGGLREVDWDELPFYGWAARQTSELTKADTIIAALDQAGYVITQRTEEPEYVPSDAVLRLREAIEKYGTPEYDNQVTLNLDDVGRIAYRAGLDRPGPEYAVTDAMIEEAGCEIYGADWDSGNDPIKDAPYWRNKVRAALIAAEKVRRTSTPPDVLDSP